MLQRLAITNPKRDSMDQHGVNLTLSIFLTTPLPIVTEGFFLIWRWWKVGRSFNYTVPSKWQFMIWGSQIAYMHACRLTSGINTSKISLLFHWLVQTRYLSEWTDSRLFFSWKTFQCLYSSNPWKHKTHVSRPLREEEA